MGVLADAALRRCYLNGQPLVTPLKAGAIQPEEWRPVPGYEGRYEVSSLGNVRSIGIGGNKKSGQPLKPMQATPGLRYVQVAMYLHGERRYYRVHQLVMAAFVGPRPPGMEINHIDGDAGNNRRDNLEYATRSENLRHAYKLGLCDVRGEKNPSARLTKAQARDIYRRFHAGEAKGVELAREFGVRTTTISAICTGKTWGFM